MLESTLKEQLKGIFAGLNANYTFDISISPAHESRQELLDLLGDVASCSDKISMRVSDGDGLELCRKARASGGIPALFLTARDEEEEMIKAFDFGADDYLVKPFSMAVLLKHIEAILRRTGKKHEIFQYENLKIDFERKQVFRETEEVRLTAKEYKLLEILAKNKGRVLTKTMLLQQVWDAEGAFVEENTVNVTLNRLKKKIEPDPSNPIYITNLFGLGYTFGK